MTAQVSDTVRYFGLDFSLAGISGDGLFEPAEHGLSPVAISTACWRGYYCTYLVQEDRLLLDTLHVGLQGQDAALAARGDGPLLFGARPGYHEQDRCFVYASLDAPVPFTGGLLLGRDFIHELYVHMGFHPAWKFRQVHELLFEQGRLLEAFDRSEAAAEVRRGLTPDDLRPGDPSKIAEWIERTFSLRYERS